MLWRCRTCQSFCVFTAQESDAKAEKRRTDNVIGGLEDRVQAFGTVDGLFVVPEVLEGAIGHCLRESMLDSEMEPQGTQRGLFVSQDVSQHRGKSSVTAAAQGMTVMSKSTLNTLNTKPWSKRELQRVASRCSFDCTRYTS